VQGTRQPVDVQRFDLASVQWNGGSNYTDNPDVRVERRIDGRWTDAADMRGEVITTIEWPDGATDPGAALAYRAGGMEWRWTAHWEPFVSRFALPGSSRATPAGTYRFVIRGARRAGRATKGYTLTSKEFRVGAWAGVTVDDIRREPDGRVSLEVGPRRSNVTTFDQDEPPKNPIAVPTELGPIDYPDSYEKTRPEHAAFIRDVRRYSRDPNAPGDTSRFELYCLECSFRPWLDVGDAERVAVTFASAKGVRRVGARRSGDRWVTKYPLRAGESAYVCPGDVRDPWGNFNGGLSATVGDSVVRLACPEPSVAGVTPATEGTAPAAVRDAGRSDGPAGVGPGETGRSSSRRTASGGCRRSTSLRTRLRAPRAGLRIRTAFVSVDGRRVRRLRSGAARRAFRVRLRRGGSVVSVRLRASDGRTYALRRSFPTCTRSR
jgi:hypothetical protein